MSNSPGITSPAGVRLDPTLRLAAWHPQGVLDQGMVRDILDFIEHEEASSLEAFDRFANLTALDAVRLSFSEVEELARSRVESYCGASVKSAILATKPLAFGMARMYSQLMRRSPIQVRVFRHAPSAAEWLGVPVEVLESRVMLRESGSVMCHSIRQSNSKAATTPDAVAHPPPYVNGQRPADT